MLPGDKINERFAKTKKKPASSTPATQPASFHPDEAAALEPSTRGNGKYVPKETQDVKLNAYFFSAASNYWVLNDKEEWMQLKGGDVKLRLRKLGHSPYQYMTNHLTEVEDAMMQLQQTRDVVWAGQLAGYPAGEHTICGQRILITKGPSIPRAIRGDWKSLGTFLRQLLGDQVNRFYGWLKHARVTLAAGPPFRSGQAFCLAGPSGCGKNLLQALITDILGRRCAKPYRYLTDKTAFNLDLLGAEHLMIQDESPSRDMRARRALGANLKGLAVNMVQSLHPKGKDAISVTPFWRISISLNDDPEDLLVLPPFEASIVDKIILLKCSMPTWPFNCDDDAGRTAFFSGLFLQIPAMLHWLDRWKMPGEMKDIRYGVTGYQDKALTEQVDELAHENHLWTLVLNAGLLPIMGSEWKGTASKLQTELRSFYKQGECDHVLSWENACGTYLGRLAKRFPLNVRQEGRHRNERLWILTRTDKDDLPDVDLPD